MTQELKIEVGREAVITTVGIQPDVVTVDGETKTQWKVGQRRFTKSHGREIGHPGHSAPYLRAATPERIAEIKAQAKARREEERAQAAAEDRALRGRMMGFSKAALAALAREQKATDKEERPARYRELGTLHSLLLDARLDLGYAEQDVRNQARFMAQYSEGLGRHLANDSGAACTIWADATKAALAEQRRVDHRRLCQRLIFFAAKALGVEPPELIAPYAAQDEEEG